SEQIGAGSIRNCFSLAKTNSSILVAGVESASHSNGETAALAAALKTIASAKIAVEIYFINSSPLVTVALGKSDSLDLHQQVGPANIRRYINGRHRPESALAYRTALQKILRSLEVNPDLRQVGQRRARPMNSVPTEILGRDQPLNVVDCLLCLCLDVSGMPALRVDDAGGAGNPCGQVITDDERHPPGELRGVRGILPVVFVG